MAETSVTITYLEMTAPPTRRAPPRPAEPLALLVAQQPPLHFFHYLYGTVGAPHQWRDMLAWAEEDLLAWLHDPAMRMTVLYRAGCPAGFFMLDWREAGVCELAYFGLTPENTGRKIGPWLLWTAIQEGWSPASRPKGVGPIERMTVHTDTGDHPAALPLYQSYGFAPVRREVVNR